MIKCLGCYHRTYNHKLIIQLMNHCLFYLFLILAICSKKKNQIANYLINKQKDVTKVTPIDDLI